MLQKFSLLILKHGAKGALPPNLPQKELSYLLDTANEIIDDKEGKKEEAACITLCVIAILSHQQNTNQPTAKLDDMAKYVKMYSFSLVFEDLRRQAPDLVKKPTLENIFDEKRFDEIRNGIFSEEFLKDAEVESQWAN